MSKMRAYISSHGGFRFVMQKYYFGVSGRSDLSDILPNLYLDTTDSDRWPQSISFEYREIRKRIGYSHSDCPFRVRVAFNISVGGYVVRKCVYSYIGHIVKLSSIAGHVRFEADLSTEERNQLANFGKIGYTGLQFKVELYRLFFSRTYASNIIHRVVKKARNLHDDDTTNCMPKLIELGNSHSVIGGLFEMVSDRGG